MRQLQVLALALLAIVPFAVPSAAALACNGVVTQVDTEIGTFYLDDRDITVGGIWLYQEGNGIPGLQSGGISMFLGENDRDLCTDPGLPADTLIV